MQYSSAGFFQSVFSVSSRSVMLFQKVWYTNSSKSPVGFEIGKEVVVLKLKQRRPRFA